FQHTHITTRNAKRASQKFDIDQTGFIEWSSVNEPLELPEEFACRAVVNLMGESVAEGRWTEEKKRRIRSSRVDGTKKLVEAIAKLKSKPEVMVSASAVGYYGDHADREITESTGRGSGFLAEVCGQWEAAAAPIAEMGIRLVFIRIGIVLSEQGGALEKMLPVFRMGGGGRLGDGKQFFPWIHIDDLVSLICWAVNTPSVSGVLNGAAPNPVTNAEFTRSLASTLHRPAVLPVPKFAVRLMLGEFADSLFDSQRVIPAAALSNGFEFQFPNLETALSDLLN
ncbi:MAG: TIGR01777 family oxidoreductase, partial [Planctomycetota bacterium]